MLEIVSSTIIGGFTYPYEFWTRDGKIKIAYRHFESDEEAIAWFKENYPVEYCHGVEMRKFDS